MRPNPRLRNREPEPGLLGLPVTLPSVPVLSPLLNPLLGGGNSKPSPQPAPNPPAPAPAPAPTPAPSPRPAPAPAPSHPGGGSSGGGNNSPSSGGGSSNGGNSGNNSGSNGSGSPQQGGNLGNSGGGSPQQGGNLGNNGGGIVPGSSGGSSQQNPGSDSQPPGSTPSVPAAGVPDGPISVIGSSTFVVTPTGLVPKPANNAIANAASSPSSSDSTHNDPASGNSESGSSPSATHAAVVTSAGSQPGISHTTIGGSNGANGSPTGGDGSDGSSNGGAAGSASGGSHISKGAVGGIVAALLLACMGVALFILRNRHKRRKDERRVEWINGYVSEGGNPPEMLQRSNSKRSSWGTPVEYRISNAFRGSFASSGSGDHSDHTYTNYIVPAPSPAQYNDFERSASGAPVLPMPVHSPTQIRAHSPDDPFADTMAQPLRRMSSLPLRISIISSVSGHEDPFGDHNTPHAVTKDPTPPGSAASYGTFGQAAGSAMFPMPPPSATSRRETLQTPGIMISFPDSPISPSFAASGTSSYPRRATVLQSFSPTPSRRDEVRVDSGDHVSVVSVYEDGWAFIQRERDNERGLVPLTHLAM